MLPAATVVAAAMAVAVATTRAYIWYEKTVAPSPRARNRCGIALSSSSRPAARASSAHRQPAPRRRGANSQLKPALETAVFMDRFQALNLGSFQPPISLHCTALPHRTPPRHHRPHERMGMSNPRQARTRSCTTRPRCRVPVENQFETNGFERGALSR